MGDGWMDTPLTVMSTRAPAVLTRAPAVLKNHQFDCLTSWIGVAMIGSLPTSHEIFPERPYAAQNVISAAR